MRQRQAGRVCRHRPRLRRRSPWRSVSRPDGARLCSRLIEQGDRHGLVMEFANPRLGVRRYLAIGIEAELERAGSQFRARGLDLVAGPLPHEQPAADATDENRELAVYLTDAKAGARLTRGGPGSLCQTIELAVHQLRRPPLRNVAGERHGPRVLVDRENRPHDSGIGLSGVMNLDWKEQRRAGQPLRILRAQIALVEVERGLAIQLEQNVSCRACNLPPWPKQIPAAGAAVADPNCLAVETDRDDHTRPRNAVTPDERLGKIGAVAGQSAGHRDT